MGSRWWPPWTWFWWSSEKDLQELKSKTVTAKLKKLNLTNSQRQTKEITDDFMKPIDLKIDEIKNSQEDSNKKRIISKTIKLHGKLNTARDDLLKKFADYKGPGATAEETLKCIQTMRDKAAQFENSLN